MLDFLGLNVEIRGGKVETRSANLGVGLTCVEGASVLGFGRIGRPLLLGSFRKNYVIGEDSVAFLRLAEVCLGMCFWDAVVSPP